MPVSGTMTGLPASLSPIRAGPVPVTLRAIVSLPTGHSAGGAAWGAGDRQPRRLLHHSRPGGPSGEVPQAARSPQDLPAAVHRACLRRSASPSVPMVETCHWAPGGGAARRELGLIL